MTRNALPARRHDHLRIALLAHLHHPIASPYAGGLEAHTAHLAEELARRGHDVTLFAKGGTSSRARVVPVLSKRFRVSGYPDDARRDHQHAALDGAMLKAVRRARSDGFDVVLNNSLSPVPYRGLAGMPTLNVFHTPPLPRVVGLFESPGWIPDPLHAFASVSESNARLWRPYLPDVTAIHNGIPLDQWGPDARRRPGQAVWSGRITPEKGTHLAIAAARRAGMDLTLAGPIFDEEYFRVMVRPELDDSIRYAGHLEHRGLRALLSRAGVFVSSPLWEEPFGLNVVEALACGTPVAALPLGAMPEIVGPDAGVVAAGLDAGALAEAMLAARELPTVGVLRAARRFSIDAMVDRYEERLWDMSRRRAARSGQAAGRGGADMADGAGLADGAGPATGAVPGEGAERRGEQAPDVAGEPAAGH
ncbi:MAG: glycosyltransferase [Arthrobacter sp.]|uniref:glycosyltransferase n=1 Tax=Arthrobacter sp. TaxID=1667 RepID=UPI00347941A5